MKHSLVALVLFGSTVLAPLLLLLREECVPCIWAGLGLFAVGVASLLGAAVCRTFDRSACTRLQWTLILASVWLLNPVLLTIAGLASGVEEVAWWSALPLGVALSLLSGRQRLASSDPDWVQEGCPLSPSLLLHWLMSRMFFIGLPMVLLSLQMDLCVPKISMMPSSGIVGLFVCGGIILISIKFCAMCACLASQKLPQALVLAVLLSADWIGTLHVMDLVSDSFKDSVLLNLLFISGVVLLRSVLLRLHLRSRWQRALAQRRARNIGADLGSSINQGESVSSDSDNEQGPGSLPETFHEALVVLLGFSLGTQAQNSRRQFLCGVRLAQPPPAPPAAAATAQTAPGIVMPTDGGLGEDGGVTPSLPLPRGTAPAAGAEGTGLTPLEISYDERVCVVCQDEIRPGDRVRPLPQCNHVFHAACLEHWARTMREATRCPTCRRPALARKEGQGSTKISELTEEESTPTPASMSSRGSRGSEGARRSRTRLQPPGGSRTGRRAARSAEQRSSQVAALRLSLGVTEPFAQVALDIAGGGAASAAHLVLEHRTVIESAYNDVAGPLPQVPSGLVQAVIEASPNLAGAESALTRQIATLIARSRLRNRPWQDQRSGEVFRVLLEDVSRVLENAPGR